MFRCAVLRSVARVATLLAVVPAASASQLFWTNAASGANSSIWRADLPGGPAAPVVASGLTAPYRIAIDPDGGKMYWGSIAPGAGERGIYRANLDGTGIERIVATDATVILGIAILVAPARRLSHVTAPHGE